MTARDALRLNLKHFRDLAELTQAQLAEAIDMSLRGYQKYEQGEAWPDGETFDKLTASLKCAPADLLRADASVAILSLAPEDLGRAIQGLGVAGPVRQACVLFLATQDHAYLERLSPKARRAIELLDLT